MACFHFFRRFILLPSFVGLVCCACQPLSTITEIVHSTDSVDSDHQSDDQAFRSEAVNQADASNSSDAAPQDTPATADQTDLAQSSLVAYQTALELAASARTLSQSAISPDDWNLVASRWSRAADQLKLVAPESEHYQQAQQKMADYAQQAAQTQNEIKRLQAEVYVPLPSSPAPAVETIPTETPASDEPTAEKSRVRVPIVRRLHGTPVVKVTFNGTREYEMILDTGASRTLITRQMANDLAVETTGQMIATTASAAEVTFDVGQVRTITMGSLTLNNAPVSIGDAVSIGLLGNDFFLGHDVIIRSRENIVELVAS